MRFHEYETIVTGARRMSREVGIEPPTEADLDDLMLSMQDRVDSSSYSMMVLHRK